MLQWLSSTRITGSQVSVFGMGSKVALTILRSGLLEQGTLWWLTASQRDSSRNHPRIYVNTCHLDFLRLLTLDQPNSVRTDS